MRPRSRFRRIAKWLGTMLSSLIFVTWLITVPTIGKRRLSVYWWHPTNEIGLVMGAMFWETYPELDRGAPPEWSIGWQTGVGAADTLYQYGILLPSHSLSRSLSLFRLPLWLPFVVIAVPTAFLWYRDRRWRFPLGHCIKCGYNLTGNTTGICPECGSFAGQSQITNSTQ